MLNTKDSFKANMIAYNHIKDMATIAYLSPKGKIKNIVIHRTTFEKLMDGKLDDNLSTFSNSSSDQKELREIISKEVKKDFKSWFETSSNNLSKEACHGYTS